MKQSRFSFAFSVCLFFVFCTFAQQTTPPRGTGQPQPAPPSSPYGQTIFSRSDSSASTGSSPQSTLSPTAKPAASSLITDAERTALAYTAYDFDVHLEPVRHRLSVQARLTARNTSDRPLAKVALQLSSSLAWYSIQVNGSPATFATETIDSDIDHTGQLTEAVVALPTPLAPGAAIHFNVIYSGTVQASSERLLRLGAPEKIAAASEWDRIGTDFTAMRGFGNVIWFPVSTAPVLLGQGSEMFDSVGKWKLRQSDARVTMHVLAEYLDEKPSIAFLNGCVVQPDADAAHRKPGPQTPSTTPARPTDAGGTPVLQVASFTLAPTKLGFSPLSLFLMYASHEHYSGLDVYSRIGNEPAAPVYEKSAETNRPLAEQWLGPQRKRPVVLVDLPETVDVPYEERNILFLPLQSNAAEDDIGPVLTHMLSHAYFISPRVWLDEGVAQFMTLLWIEQRAGRATAIGQMEAHRAALALAETSDPGTDPGQSLVQAWSDIYYRDKAANVLWMLRDVAGDTPLAQSLQSYDPQKDREPSYLQGLLDKTSRKHLEWFFDDWIYRDRGLPDLHIASAYRRPILTKNSTGKNYLVSVDVQNDSYCSAEVPVTVESGLSSQTRRLLVPSHTRAALRMLVDSQPDRVRVNDGSVPEVRTSRHEKIVRSTDQRIR
ncbi:MAG: M1 aminopeptidase family protein [Acidobacteriaceae bacterium]